MIPALERFVVGVPGPTIHNRLKLPSIDRFKELSKNAIAESHARPSVSRQPEKPDFLGLAGHAPRHIESFRGQSCARVKQGERYDANQIDR
jgi:hypothetical protein